MNQMPQFSVNLGYALLFCIQIDLICYCLMGLSYQSICIPGSPCFSGELGNYCDTSPCCKNTHYWITGVVTSWRSSVHSTKPCGVPSVRLEGQEGWTTAIQQVCHGKDMFLYGYRCMRQVHCYTYMSSYCLYSCLAFTLKSQSGKPPSQA